MTGKNILNRYEMRTKVLQSYKYSF